MFVLNISGSQAQDYYYELDPIIESNSQWYGGLSKDYKIENTACRENHFANLICGNDLAGNHVIKDGRDKSGHSFHKAGVDVVFSAPKSLSILALHTGDHKLIDAHKESVKNILDYLDKEYVYVREYDGLNTYVQKTGAGIFATFMHSTSRENDPQLHTHAILLNHTITPKGHKAVWFDKVFTDQVLINDIYQSELAKLVQDLGYQIDTNSSGKWEIAGVRKEWINNFSKRSKAIDQVEQNFKKKDVFQNANDLTIRNIAVLKSRSRKDSSQSAKKLREQWGKEIPADRIIKSVEQGKKAPSIEKISSPSEYLMLAYYSIHEHKVLFTKKDLLQSALTLSRGHYTLSDFEKTFYEMRLKEEILPVSEYVSGSGLIHRYFTSRDMKETEQAIIDQFKQGKDSYIPMIPVQKANEIISKGYDYFSDDQKKMIQYILTSKARIMLVQGKAGTGKTSSLKALRDILGNEKQGVKIIALGYTDNAAQEFKDVAGIESRTISNFINESRNQSTVERLIICNDVSMLGSLHANELIDKVSCENSRLVLIGDGKQLQVLSSGKMFLNLQEMDVPYVAMGQVLRQKTEFMQKAVSHIKDFQTGKNNHGIDDMFDLLQKNGNLIENPINSSLKESVVESYLSNKNRDDILIVTPSNDYRRSLNDGIRMALKKEIKISGKEIKVEIKVPISMPGIKRLFAENYKAGQKVFIERHDTSKEKKKYFDAVIIGKNSKANSIQVLTNDEKITWINLRDIKSKQKITLYKSQNRQFSPGDKIVFTKKDNRIGVQKGTTAILKQIDKENHFIVQIHGENRHIAINPTQDSFLDHGYALSPSKSQRSACKEVLFVADTRHAHQSKIEHFYAGLSRATNKAIIFTNNKDILKKQLNSGQEKSSALMLAKQNPIKLNTKEQKAGKEIER